MFQKILQYCKKEKLIEKEDYVLAGISGGADSVCMLLVLLYLQKEIGFVLEAVHVEHGIRGAESIEDAVFVEQLCKKQKIPLQSFSVQAVEYAAQQKLGLEEAARILRYDCYKKAAEKVPNSKRKIALAHHADDNAETVLFQMLRGSGIDGLSGMKPKRELVEGIDVIRPMLPVTRREIEGFLEREGQDFCVDSTNEDISYSRNKIRRVILPMLEEVNTKAVSHINQSALMLRELGDYINIQVQNVAQKALLPQKEGVLLVKEEIDIQPNILKKEICYLALGRVSGSAKDISSSHVEALLDLMERQVGKGLKNLPYGLEARRVYEGVLLQKQQKMRKDNEAESFCLNISVEELEERICSGNASWNVLDAEIKFSFAAENAMNNNKNNLKTGEISKKRYTKYFDYDRIKGSFQIRTRQSGDYLVVDEAGHKKRLKEYFINEKIPADIRNEMLLLTQEAKVIWVIGGRISADTKVRENTSQILKVQITGGKYYEG